MTEKLLQDLIRAAIFNRGWESRTAALQRQLASTARRPAAQLWRVVTAVFGRGTHNTQRWHPPPSQGVRGRTPKTPTTVTRAVQAKTKQQPRVMSGTGSSKAQLEPTPTAQAPSTVGRTAAQKERLRKKFLKLKEKKRARKAAESAVPTSEASEPDLPTSARSSGCVSPSSPEPMEVEEPAT